MPKRSSRTRSRRVRKLGGCRALTQCCLAYTSCKPQEAGLKSDLNRGFWGNSTLKPDWALPALATTEATHGNAITPLVTQLLMDQGKA